jgi:hypothetical protein
MKTNNIMVRDGTIPVPVIVDFGSIRRLPQGVDWLISWPLGAQKPWGNDGHVAPELYAEFLLARADGRAAAIDFSKQPVFELGVLTYEILGGAHPIDGYPHVAIASPTSASSGGAGAGAGAGGRGLADFAVMDLPSLYPAALRDLCRRMVARKPGARPELAEAVGTLERILQSLRPPLAARGGGVSVFAFGIAIYRDSPYYTSHVTLCGCRRPGTCR